MNNDLDCDMSEYFFAADKLHVNIVLNIGLSLCFTLKAFIAL